MPEKESQLGPSCDSNLISEHMHMVRGILALSTRPRAPSVGTQLLNIHYTVKQ